MTIAAIKKRLKMYQETAVLFSTRLSLFRRKRGFSVQYSRFIIKKSAVAIMLMQYNFLEPHIHPVAVLKKANLCDLLADISYVLHHFIKDSKEMAFKNNAIYDRKRLASLPKDEFTSYCKWLNEVLLLKRKDFAKYGINEQTRSSLSTAINFYDAVIAPPKAYKSLLQMSKNKLMEYVGDADRILTNYLDVLVGGIAVKKPALLGEYQKIRNKGKTIQDMIS
jgi:hypothetical protein